MHHLYDTWYRWYFILCITSSNLFELWNWMNNIHWLTAKKLSLNDLCIYKCNFNDMLNNIKLFILVVLKLKVQRSRSIVQWNILFFFDKIWFCKIVGSYYCKFKSIPSILSRLKLFDILCIKLKKCIQNTFSFFYFFAEKNFSNGKT